MNLQKRIIKKVIIGNLNEKACLPTSIEKTKNTISKIA
jgi:hypothetical protein